MLTTTLIYAGVVPFVVAAMVAIVMRLMQVSPAATWAWGTASGIIVGQIATKRQLGFTAAIRHFCAPREAVDWLPIVVLLALGVSLLIIGSHGRRRRFSLLLAALLIIAVPLRLLGGNIRLDEVWNAFDKLVYATLLAGALAIVWTALASQPSGGRYTARLPLILTVALACAVVITLSGVFVYGQLCGVVAASIAGTALAAVLIKSRGTDTAEPAGIFSGIDGAAGVIAVGLGGLILLAHFFAELSAVNALLLLAALAATGGPLPLGSLRQPGWRQLSARTACCLVPLAVAISRVV